MNSISHPLIQESIELFSGLDEETRRKISFIHLNHSNPAIDPQGDAARAVRLAGHSIARQGHQIEL
jgi:pyrroloquinoline quinone biosynthesis protein B